MRADELLEGRTDHGDQGPVALDVHVDVAIEVGHVQQPLDVVGGDLALLLEVRHVHLGGGLVGIGGLRPLLLAAATGGPILGRQVQVFRHQLLRAAGTGTHRCAAALTRQCLACSITAGNGARILRLADHRVPPRSGCVMCQHDTRGVVAGLGFIACPSAGCVSAAPAAA